MFEWWAYQPSDLLMFSPQTYYRLFELYNAGLWPAQILTLAAGVAIAILMVRGPRWRTVSHTSGLARRRHSGF